MQVKALGCRAHGFGFTGFSVGLRDHGVEISIAGLYVELADTHYMLLHATGAFMIRVALAGFHCGFYIRVRY